MDETLFTQVLGIFFPGYLEKDSAWFRYIEKVGQEGVYLGEIITSKKKIAVKIFGTNSSNLSRVLAHSFEQEVTLMEYLKNCKYTVKIVGFCKSPCCIIMEYYLVLTDFGIAHILSEKIIAAIDYKLYNLRGLSAEYASPESFIRLQDNSTVMKAGEVYSFGVIIWELVTREKPWNE